jgi:hypothetical protein
LLIATFNELLDSPADKKIIHALSSFHRGV